MNKILLVSLFFVMFINTYGQKYHKDTRNETCKNNPLNMYKSSVINDIDILKSLALLGINIYKFNTGTFDKKYNITINMDEYVDGVKISSKKIIQGNNLYYFSTDSIYTEDSEVLYNYIDQLSFYTKKDNNIVNIEVSTYATNSRATISEKKDRNSQFYSWRYYKETKWTLNEDIPLLVYASSWFDRKNNFERFCGIAVLEKNNRDTKELLDNSPHYICFSYKVTEIQ